MIEAVANKKKEKMNKTSDILNIPLSPDFIFKWPQTYYYFKVKKKLF
jgi:hypothetical protein